MKYAKIIGLVVVLLAATAWAVVTLSQNKAAIDKEAQIVEIKDVPVNTAAVKTTELNENLSMVGTVIPNAEVTVASEVMGRVKAIFFNSGDTKSTGSALVQVDDDMRQNTLQIAQINLEKAKTDLDRYQALLQDKAVTEVQAEAYTHAYKLAEAQLTNAKLQLQDARIYMPIGGTIIAKRVEIGSMLNPGTPIADVVDVSRLKVKVGVAEADVFKLKTGERVSVTTAVYPGQVYNGTVRMISPKGDESHNYPVEIELSNNSSKPLKAGMFCKVEFGSIKGRTMLTIDRNALIGSTKNPQVFVVEAGKALLKSVTVGEETDGQIEVLQGLTQGENVVISGQINLKNGSNVKVVN